MDKVIKKPSPEKRFGLRLKTIIPGLLLVLLSGADLMAGEADSSQIRQKRLKIIGYGSAATYTALSAGLYSLWYADQPRSRFHFYNDNHQWMGMDKLGHSYSAFHLSRSGAEAMQWAGISPEKASLYGSLGGFLWMLPIEIMDGFASEYGASWGDLAANAFGAVLYSSQQLLWKEIRIKPKFSFHPSAFAPLRPNTFGDNLPAKILKDYNGQTYWLSADLKSFLPEQYHFPSWLNLAFGYGAGNMLYGDPADNRFEGYSSYQQFFFSPDIDLSAIKTRHKTVKVLLFLLDGIRLPSPALELNKNRIRFHPVYF